MATHTRFDSDGEAEKSPRSEHGEKHHKSSKEKKKDRKPDERDRDEKLRKHHHGDRKDEGWKRDRERRDDHAREGRRNENNQWKRDRNARGERSDEIRRDKRRGEPDPRDNDPTKPAWATGRVLDRAKELKDRQLLFKRKEGDAAEGSSSSGEKVEAGEEKNVGMWSAALTAATGGDTAQSSKFMKLMGIKKAPAAAQMSGEELAAEQVKQNRLMNDLQKQYEVSREFSHWGKGKGLGFN